MTAKTHSAKIRISLAAAAAGLALIALAGQVRADERLQAVEVNATFEVDCATPRVPGQQEIARRFEVANFSRAYDLRNEMQHVLVRSCQRGADRVRFVFEPRQRDAAELRYVALRD